MVALEIDDLTRIGLCDMIRDVLYTVSERRYYAQWLFDIECYVWSAIHDENGLEDIVRDSERAALLYLTEVVGGWCDQNTYYPAAQWEAKHAEWNRTRDRFYWEE